MLNFSLPTMTSLKKNQYGFTLIELMITVAIAAILAAIAFPAYNEYVLRGKRSEGRSALIEAAASLERFYSDNNRYADVANTFPAGIQTTTETGKYTLAIGVSDPFQQYTIVAQPTFADPDCGNFMLTQAGVRGANGLPPNVADCWGR